MTPSCNICGSNDKTIVYDQRINLYQCGNCEHTFTSVGQDYKEEDIYNHDYFDSSHKNWFKYPNYRLFGYIHKTIIDHLKNHAFKLIDIGCGRGDLLSYLRKMEPDADLCGIDGAPCEAKDFKFIQGDFMNMVMMDKFDCITSLQCIEHINNPDLFVQKLRDLVLPGGLMVISTINSGGMMYSMAKFLNKIGIRSGYKRLFSEHHIHHFTNQSLKLLLEKHDLQIITQMNHNYSLASVDYPAASPITTLLYKALTAIIFCISNITNNGISQTVICVPGKK